MSLPAFLAPLPPLPPSRCRLIARSDPPSTPPLRIVETTAPATPFSPRRTRVYTVPPTPIQETRTPPTPLSPLQIFLPRGYPSTVAPNYLRFILLLISRQLTRSAYYVLGTTSLLRALGLGSSQALPLAAALQWVLKDGLGLFTKLLVSARLASVIDFHPRRFRLLGDSLMALSALVEICSVTRPAYFFLFGAAAATLREAAGALSGPAYRVFLDAFAVDANIGELSSRGEAQIVVGNLLGLGLGVAASAALASLPEDARLLPTTGVYALLAAAHLTATWNMVHAAQLRTLNRGRLDVILRRFVAAGDVPCVREANELEGRRRSAVRVGGSVRDFVREDSVADGVRRGDRCVVACKGADVAVLVREDAEWHDVLRAMLQAEKAAAEGLAGSAAWTDREMPRLMQGLARQGWRTGRLLIDLGRVRYRQEVAEGGGGGVALDVRN